MRTERLKLVVYVDRDFAKDALSRTPVAASGDAASFATETERGPATSRWLPAASVIRNATT
jgi:hypothetical protein